MCREKHSVALAAGLERLAKQVFRIGHLGDLNEPMILGTLAGVEMTLKKQQISYEPGGVESAISSLI